MFKEFSVAEGSTVRYTANFWFIFPNLGSYSSAEFLPSLCEFLAKDSLAYVSTEMLASFLSRREYECRQITSVEARTRMRDHIAAGEPCSSLFLRLSSECPDLCRQTLRNMGSEIAVQLIGVRAVHKLAVSCTSSSMSSFHNYNETINVMETGINSKDWSFVVYKTLTRLATKNDRSRKINPVRNPNKSNIVQMLNLVDNSNLTLEEKLAIRIISRDYRSVPTSDLSVQHKVDFLFKIVTCKNDFISDTDFAILGAMIDNGSPSTCHLTGVLLEKCVEMENFYVGWRIASSFESVNEHSIEEVVTLSSKAFFKFSRMDSKLANVWFDRVLWVVDRHQKLLGKYPFGLALHVAAHRGDFELCWSWFIAKKDEKSFRFSSHHTSSILKAATYARNPIACMARVLEAYNITPQKEKSPFVYEPLYHLWGITSECREEYACFWSQVTDDIASFVSTTIPSNENVARKLRKLSSWLLKLQEWKRELPTTLVDPFITRPRSQSHKIDYAHSLSVIVETVPSTLSGDSDVFIPQGYSNPYIEPLTIPETPRRRHSTSEGSIDLLCSPRPQTSENMKNLTLSTPEEGNMKPPGIHRRNSSGSLGLSMGSLLNSNIWGTSGHLSPAFSQAQWGGDENTSLSTWTTPRTRFTLK